MTRDNVVPKTPKELIEFIKKNDIKFVDLKFCDLPGMWQHCTFPAGEIKEESFEDGFGFDGSSIRGWKVINESDMLMMPDPDTAWIDPFHAIPTLSLTCTILDPITKEAYNRDPRSVCQSAFKYLLSTGLADMAFFGPEAEFFIFDDVKYAYSTNVGYHEVDSVEGIWNSATDEGPNLGYKPRHKEGYFPVPPTDSLVNIRSEMVLTMMQIGIPVEAHHHEVATGGQCEIDMRFGEMVRMADYVMAYKYIVKNVARRHGRTATFMAKPLFGDNGSGMHTHSSLWKDGKPLFAGDKYAGLSDMALYYTGGILKHAASILAFGAPTTNSYKRLVPGYEAPNKLALSQRNRSAACRIPMYSPSPKAKRVEFRAPDPSCNPYYTFAAILMAGLDGIQNKIDPGDPLDINIYDLPPEEISKVPSAPGSLDEALDALEADHEYMTKGDVFTPDLIANYIEYKRTNECDAVRIRPHPYEFMLYYDI